jgi:transcriptional regulator with XRE-family HTH domain
MEAIGKRIAALIRDKGLTNSQFAQEIDLNPSIVSHILSGRNKVSLQVVLQIKQAFAHS